MKNLVVKYGNKSEIRLEQSNEVTPGVRSDSSKGEVTVMGVDRMFRWIVDQVFGVQTKERTSIEVLEIKDND